MVSFQFTDSSGTSWMVLPGLPLSYPNALDDESPVPGLTFRADSGELRVLPRAWIPRPAGEIVVPLARRSRVPGVGRTDWEELLRRATRWPPA